jgi:hypothetical protein
MGNLTDDMTRLRGDVDALRSAREMLRQALVNGTDNLAAAVTAMRADFTSAHAAMAKQTRVEREAFVSAVIQEVNSLLGGFSQDRKDMARNGRTDRGAFLKEMKRQVTGLRKEMADDLLGARVAWRGQSSGKPRPVQLNPVQLKKEPQIIKSVLPPAEEIVKKTVAAPEFIAERPPVPLREPLKKEPIVKSVLPPVEEAVKKTVAAPEFIAERPPAPLRKPQPKEAQIKKDATPEGPLTKAKSPGTSMLEPDKVKAPAPAVDKMVIQKSTEKGRLDEKPAKTTTKGKRGKK